MRLGLNCPSYEVVLGVDYLPLDRDWQLVTDPPDSETEYWDDYLDERDKRDVWRRWSAWWMCRLRALSACERAHVRVEAKALIIAAQNLSWQHPELRCDEFARLRLKLIQTLGTTPETSVACCRRWATMSAGWRSRMICEPD